MMIREVIAKSILRKQPRVDSWFLSTAGMNLYRGCGHNCTYCDGRAEKYQVQGEFGCEIAIKRNALEVLKRELAPSPRKAPLRPGYILLGGGVGDAYQPEEATSQLARQVLELLAKQKLPVHILTKSVLIERDLDLLNALQQHTDVIVSMSFSSADDTLARTFEPGASLPSQRLQTLHKAKQLGLHTGMFLMPVIPFITDTPEQIDRVLCCAKEVGVDFVMFGGMTLKPGKQMDYFYEKLKHSHAASVPYYQKIYGNSPYGNASPAYYAKITHVFAEHAKKYGLAKRIPPRLYTHLLNENDRVIVMLEHLDYLMQLQGKPSPYGYAARAIAQVKEPLSNFTSTWQTLKGINPAIEKVIQEILDTKTSKCLEAMLS